MRTTAMCICACLVATTVSAQPAFRITGALANPAKPVIVSVTFSDPLAIEGPHTDPSRVRITGAPGVTVQKVALSSLPIGEGIVNPVATLVLSAPLPPGNVQVCFDRVGYSRAGKMLTTTSETCAAVSGDIEAAKTAALKALTDTPVPPDEKTLNASGFVTTASKASAGGGDIAFNPKLSNPNATAFFRLKKTTADKGDARHMEIGMAYRAGLPWNRAQLRAMREAPDLETVNDLLQRRQTSLLAGSIVNFSMKLEGEPTTFDAANGVAEAHYELLTMTRRLAGASGFWRGYVIPAGVEVGRKLTNDAKGAPTTEHDWIARYKAGGGVTMFYRNPSPRIPLARVDLSVHGMWRYLGIDELNFNPATKRIDTTTSGGHGYAQAAVKVFFAETSAGLFGIKASYDRGSLPPAFAAVKSFNFGFVVETKDKQ